MGIALDARRRLRVPVALAPTSPGDLFEADFDAEENAIGVRRLGRGEDRLTVLAECPAPMDDLPPRRRTSFKSRL